MMVDEALLNRSAKEGALNRDDVEGLFSTHDILSLGVPSHSPPSKHF